MELRSTRSRSKTPFMQTSGDYETVEHQSESAEEIVQHTLRNRNIVTLSSTSSEVFESPEKPLSKMRSVRKVQERSRNRTSDYSSEDGENENVQQKADSNRETRVRHATYTKSTNGQTVSAFQVYKEAGEYWNKFPKTDYTYSRHSKDRFEIAPGVVAMPNMSRRSLHREPIDAFTSSQNSMQIDETAMKDHRESNKHTRLEPRKLFYDESQNIVTRTVSRTFYSAFYKIYMIVTSVLSVVYTATTSTLLWLARGYYRFVGKVLIFDTWLLQNSPSHRKTMRALFAVLMLPLFLWAGWWLCSGISNVIFAATTEATPQNILSTPTVTSPPENIDSIIQRLLNNPDFESIIVKHLNRKYDVINEQQIALKSDVSQMKAQLNFVGANHVKLGRDIARCCRKQFVNIEGHVTKVLSELIGKTDSTVSSKDLSAWLNGMFVAKKDLESKLSNVTINLHAELDALVEVSAKKIMEDVSLKIRDQLKRFDVPLIQGGLTEAHIKIIVQEALAVYDADKTGLVDYALESSGGQVLSTRCTESYNARTAELSVLGIPLWYPSNTPRTVISPEVIPGKCWAFQGFPGFLVIQLTAHVNVSAFSLEHIPKTLAPNGVRDSAPKDFTVFGLASENDNEPFLLGRYEYDHDGPGLQFFSVQNPGPALNLIELRIDSNHGNLLYTCLYRFRVHGNK